MQSDEDSDKGLYFLQEGIRGGACEFQKRIRVNPNKYYDDGRYDQSKGEPAGFRNLVWNWRSIDIHVLHDSDVESDRCKTIDDRDHCEPSKIRRVDRRIEDYELTPKPV